jgi:hypothetical protein
MSILSLRSGAKLVTLDGIDIFHDPGAPSSPGWWDPNGEKLCILQALQAKGAVDFASSLLDLSGNGNNATDPGGGSSPSWDAVNGWGFVSANTQYLRTGITPTADTWTYIAQFTNGPGSGSLFGMLDSGKRVYILPNGVTYSQHSAASTQAPGLASGNLAVTGDAGYRNGISDISVADWQATGTAQEIYIGAIKRSGSITNYQDCNIQAFCIYNCILTPTQVLAVATAMAAL